MSQQYPSYQFRAALCLGVSLAFAGSVQAQTDDAVVVTASRVEQQIKDAIPNTTVITQSEIKASGATDLPSLLRGNAGVELSQNGGLGSVSSLFLRGGNSAHTLVLIDGVRIESATTGTTPLEHIMLDDVERIEIVRGNVSALYGSGAMGGVVQIFTRSGAGAPGATLEAVAGSRGTQRLGASYASRTDDTRLALAASETSTRGFSAIDPNYAPAANPDRDGYRNASVSGQLARRLAAGHEVGLRYYRSEGKTDYDNPFGATLQETNRTDTTLQNLSAYLDNRVTDAWRSRLTVAEGRDNSDDLTDGQPNPFGSRFDSRNRQITWQNDLTPAQGQVLTASAERLAQDLSSDTAYTGTSRTVESVALGYNGRLGAHALQAGTRRDRYSDVGAASTGLLGYGYELSEAWKLTALGSTAFRAPTFNDLYYPGFSNPALRPERSRSVEAGVQYAQGQRLLRAVMFRTRTRDLILFDPLTSVPVNVAHARVSGTELTYSATYDGGWRARASLTVQNPLDEDTGRQLRKRAKSYLSGEVSREAGPWRLGGEVVSSASRPDADVVTGAPVTLAPYTVVNLSARYRVDRTLEGWARLENATDRRYQLAHGYNTPQRGVFLGVRWQPGD
jgi:vitamin B12 transporter